MVTKKLSREILRQASMGKEGTKWNDILKEIHFLYQYVLQYETYLLLNRIKKVIIPSNKGTEYALSPIDKLFLHQAYIMFQKERENNGKKAFLDSVMLEGNISQNFKHLLSDYDFGLLEDSFDRLRKLLKIQEEVSIRKGEIFYPRFTQILGSEISLKKTKDSLLDYYRYQKKALPFIDKEDFLSEYFSLDGLQNLVYSEDDNSLYIWFYFVKIRVYLFDSYAEENHSKSRNMKSISAYSKNPLFLRNTEYDYYELEKKLIKKKKEIMKELEKIEKGTWLKSILFDYVIAQNKL